MSGEIMCNEAEVFNILGGLNAICTSLQSSMSDLNGMDADASRLGLANFNTSQAKENIGAVKKEINNIIEIINDLLKEFANAEELNIEIIDKLLDIYIFNNTLGETTSEILRKVAEELKIPTTGETTSDLIRKIAEELKIPTTIIQEGAFGKALVVNQKDYTDNDYGKGKIAAEGCAPCAVYTLGTGTENEMMDIKSYLERCKVIREKYDKDYPYPGTPDIMFQDEEFLALTGIKFEGSYGWMEAYANGRLDEDLDKGYRVIVRAVDTAFTSTGHYMAILGKTEDGKYLIGDPNGDNWEKEDLSEGYENGFSLEFIKENINDGFYAFSVSPTEISKDDYALLEEILEVYGYKPQNSIEEPK